MRLLINHAISWLVIFVSFSPSIAFADRDPVAGSIAAKDSLVGSYRESIRTLLAFEAYVDEIYVKSNAYSIHRDTVTSTIFQGLDNIDSFSANRLIVDLSAVYFGEATGPIYLCLVQRKARHLKIFLKKYDQYSLNDWCKKDLPAKYCLSNQDSMRRLKDGIEDENDPECGLPFY